MSTEYVAHTNAPVTPRVFKSVLKNAGIKVTKCKDRGCTLLEEDGHYLHAGFNSGMMFFTRYGSNNPEAVVSALEDAGYSVTGEHEDHFWDYEKLAQKWARRAK